MKKYINICLISMMTAIFITGCNNSSSENTTEQSVASETEATNLQNYMDIALEKALKITSFGSDFYVNILMDNEAVDMHTIAKIEINNEDLLLGHIQVETIEGELNYHQNTYLEEIGESVSILTENYSEWTEIKYSKEEALDVIGAYYGIRNFIYFIENGHDWIEVQSEQITNKNIITAQCTIPANEIYNMIQNTHLFYFMGMNQIEEECYENVSDIQVQIQFDKNGNPISLSTELGEVLEVVSNYIVAQLGGSLKEADVQSYRVDQNFYDLNSSPQIQIPIEARDAVNYDNEIYMINEM